jgi:hypothetical protein
VSGIGSAFSVMDIWGIRDDAPPSGRRAANHGRAILRHGPNFSRKAASWRWRDWQNHLSSIVRRVGCGFFERGGVWDWFRVFRDGYLGHARRCPSKRSARGDSWEGQSSGMAQDSAAKRRYGDGGIGKIIFRGSCGELVVGFLSGVVSGTGSAFLVIDIWGMRDDAPLSGRRAATHGRAILRHGPNLSREAALWRWRDWQNDLSSIVRRVGRGFFERGGVW